MVKSLLRRRGKGGEGAEGRDCAPHVQVTTSATPYERKDMKIHHCRWPGLHLALIWWGKEKRGVGHTHKTDVRAWSVPPAGQPADVGAEVQEGVDHDGVGHGTLDAGPLSGVALEEMADELPQALAVARVYRLQSG